MKNYLDTFLFRLSKVDCFFSRKLNKTNVQSDYEVVAHQCNSMKLELKKCMCFCGMNVYIECSISILF